MVNSDKNDNEKLRNIYFDIDDIMYQLLAKYNDNSFVEDPSVPIRAIALENGIKDIIPVPPEEINCEHAVLDNGIIKLNNTDKDEEQCFSIGHELKHFLLGDEEYYNKKVMKLKDPYIVFEKPEVKAYVARYVPMVQSHRYARGEQAARAADNLDSEKTNNVYKSYFDFLSVYIAEIVSNNMGKTVIPKKAYNVINKIYTDYSNDKDNDDKKVCNYANSRHIITDAINKLYDEEKADYFAANLLVPTNRFILWEDKEDEEIAKAFKVPIGCIKKRREEIEHEIEFTTLTVIL
jgi:Zn-dependent peptidase ImmA (M78 family)